MSPKLQITCLAVIAVGLLVVAGCGNAMPETVQVSGTITYGGGPWPKSGTLYFVPKSSDRTQPLRPATADFSKDGMFTTSSFARGDGLVPGKYSIRVECWEFPPTVQLDAPPEKSYVPQQYQLGTADDLQLDVPTGSPPIKLALDVPKS